MANYLLVVKKQPFTLSLAYAEKLIEAFRLARFLIHRSTKIYEVEIFHLDNLKTSYVIKQEFIT